ncbi:MAG TPA: diacylglycerol kinase family protein [Terriglobales bacterium]|nr:diacylglycerol kinase family protein [Terriglobales bacterium]
MLRSAALIYNPVSGRQDERRRAQVEAVATVLRQSGVRAAIVPSKGPRMAGEQARQLVAEGCGAVFACGGDGTVHDVLQGLVFTQAALGVIPMGTANALAHDLGLPRDPEQAAQAALTASPQRIAVGRISYQDKAGQPSSRYFVIAVGIGVDADLFYRLHASMKQRMGMGAYYAEALRLWLTHDMGRFEAEFSDARTGELRREAVSQALAVRITQFGGVLRRFAPEAALRRNDVQLVLFKTSSRLPYLMYILRSLAGGRWRVPGVELAHSTRLICRPLAEGNGDGASSRIYVEADGEVLGSLPVEMTVVPSALTLLVPQHLAREKVRDGVMTAAPRVGDAVS